uniref:RhoGEF domain containing protein n=1 Tax=Coptotermes formosanus TaxID=36987 RepID=R4V2F7_COPFO|nr:RhoGEF domain containing protein [Coptotermes formosanus]
MSHLYTEFSKTRQGASEELEKALKKKEFLKFTQGAMFEQRAKGREIDDFLILPVQRPSQYKSLIERVFRYFTPNSPEALKYKELLQSISELGFEANLAKVDQAETDKLLVISETVQKLPPHFCLTQPGRKPNTNQLFWLFEENRKDFDRVMIYLLSDALILATLNNPKNVESKQTYKEIIPLTQVKIENCPVSGFENSGFTLKSDILKYVFLISNKKNSNESRETMDQFIQQIKTAQKSIRDRIKQQTKNGNQHVQELLNQLSELYLHPPEQKSRAQMLADL